MTKESRHINPRRHVALRLGERVYAFDLLYVQEIIFSPELEPCLDGPELVIGTFRGSRGELPVVDLLGRGPDECPLGRMALVIIEYSGRTVCVLVDGILDIVELDPSMALPVPGGANGVPDDMLCGIVNIIDCDYYLLDLDRIISAYIGCSAGTNSEAGERGPEQ